MSKLWGNKGENGEAGVSGNGGKVLDIEGVRERNKKKKHRKLGRK